MLTFIDFFAGIGGFHLGMETAGHKCVGWCEIDKFARKSYEAMCETKGLWTATDIRAVEPSELPEAGIYTFGFPCQSSSIAGRREGFADTRGTLFFEVMRLAKVRKPKYLIGENVAGLLSHDGGRTFEKIISTMAELGYSVEWQVINSKYYVPQNRERVFIVGHSRKGRTRKIFPIRETHKKADGVQEQPAQVKQIIGGGQGNRVYDSSGISVTLSSDGGGKGAKTGLYAIPVSTIDLKSEKSSTRRGIFKENYIGSLDTYCYQAVLENMRMRIRKLTPKECFRLQGFPDEYFDKAKSVNSDSQLYKQAGNSVTVPVVYEIAKRLGGTK